MDHVPLVNIAPFGMCRSLANPRVAAATSAALGVLTPQPCMPDVSAPWSPGGDGFRINRLPVLTDACTCSCKWGGMIRVSQPGAHTVQLAHKGSGGASVGGGASSAHAKKGGAASTKVGKGNAAPLQPKLVRLSLITRAGEPYPIVQVSGPLRVLARAENAPPSALESIVWSVTVDGVPVSEPSWIRTKGDKLKIARVPTDWSDKNVDVSASFPGQPPVALAVHVARCEVAEYIALVRKVEAAYPAWTSEEVLGALRRIAGVGSRRFQWVIYGVKEKEPPAEPAPAGALTGDDIRRMRELSQHKSRGFAGDMFGIDVAMGHVLIGMAAGMHFRRQTRLFKRTPLWDVPVDVDCSNVDFVTVAGDLGQSTVIALADKTNARVGGNTEASDPELIGDIDGFVLGMTVSPKGLGPISKVLHDYYGCRANDHGSAYASDRIKNFKMLITPSELRGHTYWFASAFAVGAAEKEPDDRPAGNSAAAHSTPKKLSTPSTDDIAATMAEFDTWLERQRKLETDRAQDAARADEADAKEGWP